MSTQGLDMAARGTDPWCFWTEGDQLLLAALAAAALAGMLAVRGWSSWAGRPWQEVDQPRAPGIPLQVDVNQADWPELMLLPGVGETLARRIVDDRRQRGMFRRPADLLRVPGLGEKTVARLRPWLAPLPPDGE